MLRLVVLATALALVQSAPAVAECATSHFVVDQEAVSQHDEDGTIVPGSVSHGAVDLCDQIAAIGPDGTVRGVSDIIDQGFSLAWLGTTGEEIEFRFWSGAEEKEYFVHAKHTMAEHNILGHFTSPYELALSAEAARA